MNILIVNDSGFEQTVMENTVKELGYHAKSCDEYSAVNFVKKERPDIVLVNLHMKETCGDFMIEKLKNIHQQGKFVLTSSSQDKLADKKELSAVDEILTTPADGTEIKKLIETLKNDN
ncbi:MAG: response regulator [Tindallia sp. MSAO_Bac2]|nr:MAG: response regulator [Tindallia sp. MSAO_Bac2]